ncbi:MAG: histidinol-phosphatase HisJ family protein [Armatimonadota bacterium]|nr:histidinol-phosphatase HisJ family protein [bacterium]
MIDYHVHSVLSGDASQTILAACKSTLDVGVEELCFTEHADFHPSDPNFNCFDYQEIKRQVEEVKEKYGDRLIIRLGVEIDYQQEYDKEIREFLGGNEFDYVLGSIHYVSDIPLVDHPRLFTGRIPRDTYGPYFDAVLGMIETELFDTVAHLDVCKRHGVKYYGEFDPEPFAEQIRDILAAAIRREMTIEINTSGLHQSPHDTYPSRSILEEYRSIGGTNITVGSDSHHLEHVGSGIGCALALARDLGFDCVDTFNQRQRGKRTI